MQYDLCRHIKTNGTQCGSPALDHHAFCFFHQRLHRRHAAFRHVPAPALPGMCDLQLSPLEDRDAIQSALSVIIHALAANQIETRRATALFYGLQLASMNVARLNSAPFPPDVLVETTAGPDGLDIALPGNTRNLTTDIAHEVYDEDEYQEEPDEETLRQEKEQEEQEMERLRVAVYGADYDKDVEEPISGSHPRKQIATYPPDTAQSTRW